jgi:hypothetical protein
VNIKSAFVDVEDEQFNSIKMHGTNNIKLTAVRSVSGHKHTLANHTSEIRMCVKCERF